MSKQCNACKDIIERTDLPHVVRKCSSCGREMHIYEPGDNGIGFKVQKGDKFFLPDDLLTIAFNPLKSSGRLTIDGLNWFAKLIHFEEFPQKEKTILNELERLEQKCDQALHNSKLLQDLQLDIHDPEHNQPIFENLKDTHSVEWWYFLQGLFISCVQGAIAEGDIEKVAWAMSGVERARAMTLFKEYLEEVVWMGHSAKRIIDFLNVWDSNKANSNEGFWQTHFRENTYAVSQLFASPIIYIGEQVYVGGMGLDRKGAKYVDYLFATHSSREVVLVEIKTPATRLLGAEYRDSVYKPSPDLTGAIVQAADYRNKVISEIDHLTRNTDQKFKVINPRCILIVGDSYGEFDNEDKRRSFELFRSSLKDIEIVTYDELFKKLEILVSLFSLRRTSPC